MREDDFIGQHFTWYTGLIEDIKDPLILNRVRVRCIGYHSMDKAVLPTADLPWATVIMPNTSASYQGVGANHHLEVGTWVVGFFRDGSSAQDPMVMGSIATQENGVTDIPTEAQKTDPTNKVYKSKAGHLIEIDNTDGSERISIKHKTGSKIVFNSDGTVSQHTVSPDMSRSDTGDNVMWYNDDKFYMPWANTNKKGIAKMYRDENIIDSLLPVTRSCEWDPTCDYYDVIGTVDPYLGHCGECWWCKEREWGFK